MTITYYGLRQVSEDYDEAYVEWKKAIAEHKKLNTKETKKVKQEAFEKVEKLKEAVKCDHKTELIDGSLFKCKCVKCGYKWSN